MAALKGLKVGGALHERHRGEEKKQPVEVEPDPQLLRLVTVLQKLRAGNHFCLQTAARRCSWMRERERAEHRQGGPQGSGRQRDKKATTPESARPSRRTPSLRSDLLLLLYLGFNSAFLARTEPLVPIEADLPGPDRLSRSWSVRFWLFSVAPPMDTMRTAFLNLALTLG